MALQTIAARNIHPLQSAVITVGAFNSGIASNVIPERAEMSLTVRALEPQDQVVQTSSKRSFRLSSSSSLCLFTDSLFPKISFGFNHIDVFFCLKFSGVTYNFIRFR